MRRWLRWGTQDPRLPGLVFLLKRYLRWSSTEKFDVRLRYSAAIRLLKRSAREPYSTQSVLDAGCGPLGIAQFVSGRCVGIDIRFPDGSNGYPPNLQRIKGSITRMPFRDLSFGIVASIDTLEHIRPPDRRTAVTELFRVANKTVLLGVPFGDRAAAFDRWTLEREYDAGRFLDWRQEHVANGLPAADLDAIISELGESRNASRLVTKKHENLSVLRLRWKVGMRVSGSSPAYGVVMLALNILARITNFGACYRRLYCVVLRE